MKKAKTKRVRKASILKQLKAAGLIKAKLKAPMVELSVTDETPVMRFIKDNLALVSFSVEPLPSGKRINNQRHVYAAYTKFIEELGGAKVLTNKILGIELATELRRLVSEFVAQHQDEACPEVSVASFLQFLTDWKVLSPLYEKEDDAWQPTHRAEMQGRYRPMHRKADASSLFQPWELMRDDLAIHFPDDGRMWWEGQDWWDEESNRPASFGCPYYRVKNNTVDVVLPTFSRRTGECYKVAEERAFAVFFCEGAVPCMKYTCAPIRLASHWARATSESLKGSEVQAAYIAARTLSNLYRDFLWKLKVRDSALKQGKNGHVHVHYLEYKLENKSTVCLFSPILAQDRKTQAPRVKPPVPVDDDFYSQ